MAKSTIKFTDEDDALLDELGVNEDEPQKASRPPREERIIAGFEDIKRFYEQNGRLPVNGENRDIFERLDGVRLDKIRASEDCCVLLADVDEYGLLQQQAEQTDKLGNDWDDDQLLAELGVLETDENDITKLTHVKTRMEIRAAEEIAQQTPCVDFYQFKPLFVKVQQELQSGIRTTREFKDDAKIKLGDFFILSGKIIYVAELGEEIRAPNGEWDARLRVIYDNKTESNLLRRSLQRALYKDEAARRITDPSAGPLFSDTAEDSDIETGKIYILRSHSQHPHIREHRDVIHKIGVTSGDINKRLTNAKLDPTFLMADVEVIATYELSNINCLKLEHLIHRFFEPSRLDIEIKDRFGYPITPREWFLVPLFVINEAVEKIKDGSLINFSYDTKTGKIIAK